MLERALAYHREQVRAYRTVLDTDGNLFSEQHRNRALVGVLEHEAILEELTALVGDQEVVRHRKRGSTYDVLGDAMVQSERPLRDTDTVTLYRDRETGAWFVRAPEEMTDGRFEGVQS